MTKIRSIIAGCGSFLPENIMTNDDLAQRVDTSDEWITQRTGIKQRHIASATQDTAFMATKAAEAALKDAGYTGADIDTVIVATTTAGRAFPSVAVKVQHDLGATGGAAFDLQAACAGFVYAISTASALIETGQASRVLVIGADKYSDILDWTDRNTCVLFGDGAGAVVLEGNVQSGTFTDQGVLSTHLKANGAHTEILKTGDKNTIEMDGKDVFRYAVQYMSESVDEILAKNNLVESDIDFLVPHQANIRIIESIAKRLKMPMDRVAVTVDQHGNTSAASIPLALDHLLKSNKVKRGDLLLLEGLGAGLTWGAALVRY